MKKWNLIIDVEKCEDCNNCFLACKDEHMYNDWPGYALPQPRHIVLTGGLSEIARLGHLLANIAKLPVLKPPFVEATARGVVRLAIGSHKSWPAGEPHMLFFPVDDAPLDRRFAKWKSLMQEATGIDPTQEKV